MAEAKIGRPRSESTRRAILESTRDLIGEAGYPRLTIDAIAARAGAGRQTVYRWWPSKALIVADAVIEGYLAIPAPGIADTGDLRADLRTWISATVEAFEDSPARQIVHALVVAASDDEVESGRLYDHVTGPLRAAAIARLTTSRADGQLGANVDPTVIADAMLGTILFRFLTGLPIGPTLTGLMEAVLPEVE
ncbi:TetR/AcrR family transcriptional regulator C-terminal ligand-binding domain-containing protein [Microbacteriaceae bacterium VKM Ac-2854]|nr:TetR/AcrR family transcriptional regulator C-terminal ligand-binding domain-containing protein [Microbacteriaceae bacterium VKM Ac-2854]